MSVYYTIYAEARIKDKWVGFNPYIRRPNGELVIAPLYGWEQSWFREAYDKLNEYCSCHGLPDDLSDDLITVFKPEEMTESWGKPITRREACNSYVFQVNYDSAIKMNLTKDKPHKYSGYVDKEVLASFQIGEIDEIYEWLDETQYRELDEKHRRKWSYFEWDNNDSWYAAFHEIEGCVESMRYWFNKNGDYHDSEYSWDDFNISSGNIRLIVEVS